VLSRGYAIAFDQQGQAVHDAGSLAAGQRLTLRLHRGERQVEVRGESDTAAGAN